MKKMFLMMCIMLGGCAHQGDANIMQGELFVSENKQHKIRLNPKKIYTFSVGFGHRPKTISSQDDEDL